MVNWAKLFKQIPIKVQVGPKTNYEVTWVRDDDSLDHVGISYHNEVKRIVLRLDKGKRESVITYLHELAHTVSVTHKMDLTESQILKLEKAMYYLLKSNNVFKEGR